MFFFTGDTIEDGKPNVCSLFTISKHWIDTEVTWQNADNNTPWEMTDYDTKFFNPATQESVITPGGCDFDHENLVIADYVDTNEWEDYDVTEIFKKMYNNQIPNYGFMIKQFVCIKDTGVDRNPEARMNSGKNYWSSEYTEIEKRPKLTVKYEQTSINPNNLTSILNNDIVIKKSGGNLKIFIPYENDYTATINDIKGRKLLSCEVKGEKWISLPITSIANGTHIINVKYKGRTLSKTLLLLE